MPRCLSHPKRAYPIVPHHLYPVNPGACGARYTRDATTSMSPAPTGGGDYSHHDLRTTSTSLRCWEAIFRSGDDVVGDDDDRGDSDGDNQKEKK